MDGTGGARRMFEWFAVQARWLSDAGRATATPDMITLFGQAITGGIILAISPDLLFFDECICV